MELYDKLVEEGRKYLGEEASSNSSHQIAESEADVKVEDVQQTSVDEEENIEEDSDLEFMLNLQGAFEAEDWARYSELIKEIKSDDAVIKQAGMACQMINSDLTTDIEKEEAIKYIKDNHSKILELF